MIEEKIKEERKRVKEAVRICLENKARLAMKEDSEYVCFIKPHREKKACIYQGALVYGDYLCKYPRK